MTPNTLQVSIRPGWVLWFLIAVSLAICGGYVVLEVGRWDGTGRLREILDPNAEANLAAWFSGTMLATTALLSLIIGLSLHNARRVGAPAFLLLAAGFLVLSADEVATLHEQMSMGLYTRFARRYDFWPGRPERYDIFPYGLYALTGLLSILLLRRHYLTLWRHESGNASLVLGVACLVIGAAGIDALPRPWEWRRYFFALEEAFEMIGAALLVHGMLLKLGPTTLLTAPGGAGQSQQ